VGTAELRRREDVYLGFCIAALVACCEESGPGTASISANKGLAVSAVEGVGSASNAAPATGSATALQPIISKRASYIAQLQAVVLGKGAKSQRRLTIRSRLRAAFALQLIVTNAGSTAKCISASVPSSSSTTSNTASCAQMNKIAEDANGQGEYSLELNRMVPFLECLAELQETRLPCSEEVLMDALCSPPSISSTFPSSSCSLISVVTDKEKEKEKKVTRTDVRVLVRTWLHDEGSHQEVGKECNNFHLDCIYHHTRPLVSPPLPPLSIPKSPSLSVPLSLPRFSGSGAC
jgi:hypothetical protein